MHSVGRIYGQFACSIPTPVDSHITMSLHLKASTVGPPIEYKRHLDLGFAEFTMALETMGAREARDRGRPETSVAIDNWASTPLSWLSLCRNSKEGDGRLTLHFGRKVVDGLKSCLVLS